jgi:protein SCO1/2
MKHALSVCLLFLFLAGAPLVLADSATGLADEAPDPGPVTTGEVNLEEQLGATIPLDVEFLDEQGRGVTLRQLIDKPTLLTLNYFTCPGICTPQLVAVVDILDKIDLEPAKDFQVITVSFDVRDTPERALTWKQKHLRMIKRRIPLSGWRFLTGRSASIQALTDAVGFSYQRRGEDFVHPTALIVVSPEGKVTRYVYGLSYLPFDVQMAVAEASQGLVRPTIAKVLRVCFSYDPGSRRYVFRLTQVVGLVTLFSAAVFISIVIFAGRKNQEEKS